MTGREWVRVIAFVVPLSIAAGLVGQVVPLLYAWRKLKTL